MGAYLKGSAEKVFMHSGLGLFSNSVHLTFLKAYRKWVCLKVIIIIQYQTTNNLKTLARGCYLPSFKIEGSGQATGKVTLFLRAHEILVSENATQKGKIKHSCDIFATYPASNQHSSGICALPFFELSLGTCLDNMLTCFKCLPFCWDLLFGS